MSKKISQLYFDEFDISGEVNERLPRYTEGLYAHYPLDGTLNNAYWDAEIYVENNTIKTKGTIPDIIKTNSNVTVTNGGMYFTGDTSCYLELNKELLNNAKDFDIEIKFNMERYNSSLNTIFQAAGPQQYNLFSLIVDGKGLLYSDMYDVDVKKSSKIRIHDNQNYNAFPMSNYGSVTPGEEHTIKVSRNNNTISVYIDEHLCQLLVATFDFNVHHIVVGQEEDGYLNFDPVQSFIGHIYSIKVRTDAYKVCIGSSTPHVTEHGVYGSEAGTNISSSNNIFLYNNRNLPATIEPAFSKFNDLSIYRVNHTINDQTALNNIINLAYRDTGVNSTNQTFLANTQYCAAIMYRPISHKDMTLGGNATNIGGWNKGIDVELTNGWRMYYQYRTGDVTTDKSDSIFFSVGCPSAKLNDTIVYEVSNVTLVKDRQVPLRICKSGVTTEKNAIVCDHNKINSMINNFSFAFETVITTHTTNPSYPQLCYFGDWNADLDKDWIGVYRGRGWNLNRVSVGATSKENQKNYNTGFDITNRIGHVLYIGLSYNRANQELYAYVFDKTTNEELLRYTFTGYKFNSFTKLVVNNHGNDLVRNISIYNKTLSFAQHEINARNKFSLKQDGSFHNRIKEHESVRPDNRYFYFPFSQDAVSTDGTISIYQPNSRYYAEGGMAVGSFKAAKILDLCKSFYSSAIPCKDINAWNKFLHWDSIRITGWSDGYNSGVTNPEKGYHAKWVYEGPKGEPCVKFINHNDLYGHPNRWLGVSRSISENEFWNLANIGDKVTVTFKAKASKPNSHIHIGIHRKKISDGQRAFCSELGTKLLTNSWKDYSMTFTIDSDWDLTTYAQLYVYGYHANPDIIWATDFVITLNSETENITSDICHANSTSDKMFLNLYRDAGLKWNEPWTIFYWKKTYGSGSNSALLFAIDSLGSNTTSPNGYYMYWGRGNVLNKFIAYTKINNNGLSNLVDNNDIDYFGKWHFFCLRYTGSQVKLDVYSENGHKSFVNPTTIETEDAFVTSNTYDLQLGGWDNNTNTGSSIFKDLYVLKNKCLTDEEVAKIGQTKMSFKNNELKLMVNLQE